MHAVAISDEVMQNFINFLSLQGIDRERLLQKAGINESFEDLTSQDEITASLFCRLFKAAVNIFEEDGMPLVWAGGLGSQVFKTLCYCIETAGDLREVLQRSNELTMLLGRDNPCVSYDEVGGFVALNYNLFTLPDHESLVPSETKDEELYKAIAIYSSLEVWGVFCSWLIGSLIDIERIELSCRYISDIFHQKLLLKFRSCTISYGCEYNRFFFEKKYLEYPIVRGKGSMSDFLETLPFPLIAITENDKSTRARVKEIIDSSLDAECPHLEDVAKCLKLSPSSLRRRLIKEGTSFQTIKNECRRDIAIVCLQSDRVSVGELSVMLGFKDVGSFSRSFRRWVGLSPKAFRSKHCPGAGSRY